MKQEVHGNLTGIRDSVIDALASLYNYEVEDGDFLPRELMQFLAKFTGALNREIAVYITRDGEIVDVSLARIATWNCGITACVAMPSASVVCAASTPIPTATAACLTWI